MPRKPGSRQCVLVIISHHENTAYDNELYNSAEAVTVSPANVGTKQESTTVYRMFSARDNQAKFGKRTGQHCLFINQ